MIYCPSLTACLATDTVVVSSVSSKGIFFGLRLDCGRGGKTPPVLV